MVARVEGWVVQIVRSVLRLWLLVAWRRLLRVVPVVGWKVFTWIVTDISHQTSVLKNAPEMQIFTQMRNASNEESGDDEKSLSERRSNKTPKQPHN